MIRATVLATASAIFLMVSGTALSSEAPQAALRRIVRYQYFFCTAVNYIMAELYRRAGDTTSEAARRSKAEKVFEEGKKDLIEVGKDPSEAEGRVQKHIDEISDQVEADPQIFRVMDKACAEHFPD